MPEYWLKYGDVEVSAEIDDEVRVEKISIDPNVKYDFTTISRLADNLTNDRSIAIVYDYASSGDLELLRSFLTELEARGFEKDKIKLLASSWRIHSRILEEELGEALKAYRKCLIYPWSEGRVELGNVTVSRSILEASDRVIISSILPHGVIGFPSIRETLLLNGWITCKEGINDYWSSLREELKLLGLFIGGGTIFSGYVNDVEEECMREAEKTYTVKLGDETEIVLVDAGGWPWDSTLESSLHIIGLVSEGVGENGLIGLVAECREGLGSIEFIRTLFSSDSSGDTISWKTLKMVKEVIDVKKIALVTTIPRSLLDKTLQAKGFDTLQDLLTYGFRMYSKHASVRIVSGVTKLIR